jgi:dsDNA-specific endonuclease/ATPase MutS2
MTQSSESRLDRIENILLSTTTRLDQVSQQQQVNTEAIAQLTTRMEQGFVESRRQLEETASYLVGVIGDFVEKLQQDRSQAEQDRAIIREMQTEVRGLQTENQRILQYLFGQRGEGEV